MRSFSHLLVMAAVVVGLSVTLSACGRKGSLTPPDGSRINQTYPSQ